MKTNCNKFTTLAILLGVLGCGGSGVEVAGPPELPERRLPRGESLHECEECGAEIPAGRREALPGVRLCVACQSGRDGQGTPHAGYNRRGNKDSQLR